MCFSTGITVSGIDTAVEVGLLRAYIFNYPARDELFML
jgi:hypothetical protein